jgi:capsular exopolysaccharide synthesis family protein
VAPSAPISPRPKRAAAIAFALALLNGLILVYLIEFLDRRVRRVQDLTAGYELPMLSVVPHVREPKLVRDGRAALDPGLVESMRFLRVNLSLQTLDRPVRLLLVTSAVPGEGKSTVVRNLAIAYREAGSDVVVVDADLRQPALARGLGSTQQSPGLTSVLLGDAELADAVVRATVDLPGIVTGDGPEPAPSVGLLPSGGLPANPPAILGSARMSEVLHELAANHELIIIDSPPLLSVSDALPLLPIVDGVILVARPGFTTRDAIRRVKAVLASIPTARVFGTVAQDTKQVDDYGYGYGSAEHTGDKLATPLAETMAHQAVPPFPAGSNAN